MARIKYAPGVDPIFGQIEGFVFQSNSYGQTMKSKPKMRTWKSTVQKLRNAYFTTANNNWKNMTIGSRTAWNNFANVYPQPTHHDATKFLNGYNLFVQRNYFKFLAEYQNFTFMDVPVFTSPLNDTFTAVAKLDAGVLTLEFTFTRGDSTLQCLMNVSKTNYPSLHYIGSGTRYVGSILNTNQNVDITDQYLSFYGRLPAEGDFIYVGLTQNSLVGGQTYFSAPVLVNVTAPISNPVKLGMLYNRTALIAVANIAAAGWESVTYADRSTILAFIASNPTAGGQMKETGLTYWQAPNTGATNARNTFMRAAGFIYNTGIYSGANQRCYIWTPQIIAGKVQVWEFRSNQATFNINTFLNAAYGVPIRLKKTVTTLAEGETGTYIQNDGRVLETIVLAGIEMLSSNLAETKFRDGSDIPLAPDTATWKTVFTSLRAYPNYNINNV